MTLAITTPRDKLDHIIAFLRRATRYWWLIAITTLIGGAVAALVAFVTGPRYVSEATLVYNERINSSVLQGRHMSQRTDNLGNRYREILLARRQLEKVVERFHLFQDIVAEEGMDAAVDELQKLIAFRIRGAGVFHIQFASADPALSQGVTGMLVDLLIEEDRRLRRETASATKNFLIEEKAKVNQELHKRMAALAGFLAEHPEFAEDSLRGPQAATGAGVRAVARSMGDAVIPNAATMDPRLLALERQRMRLRARLAAPAGRGSALFATSEERQARRAAREARRDLHEAERRLAELLKHQLKAAHPDVLHARAVVAAAKKLAERAEADVSRFAPLDRDAMVRELGRVERHIASTRQEIRAETGEGEGADRDRDGDAPASRGAGEDDNWVVALETQFARLTQDVEEIRRRAIKLDASLTDAEITASQQMAEDSAVLTIIDPANLPGRPRGKGPFLWTAAGLVVFAMLGCALAFGLALVDDRIYSAGDVDVVGIAPVVVVIPGPARKRSSRG